jgi:glycerol uptake facilitator protein
MFSELLAESFGTFLLVLIGDGVVAMVVLSGGDASGEIAHGGYTNITIGWGLATTMAIYIASRISGAHLNPAVSISLAIYRDFPWRKVVPYIVAQTLGAFAAAALVYWNYLPAFEALDPGLEKTANILTTLPTFPQVPFAGLLNQTIGTAILLLMMLAITDEQNEALSSNSAAALLGIVVVAIGMAFGDAHGYAINPARDLGPRLFTAVAGFRNNGLTDGDRIFWVPIAGPILGGIIGSAAYDYGIRRFLPEI